MHFDGWCFLTAINGAVVIYRGIFSEINTDESLTIKLFMLKF